MTNANANNGTPSITLATLAANEAVTAIRADDRAQFNATVSVALVLASRQAESAGTDVGIDDKKNNAYFRGFAKHLAYRGVMVWRDTQHLIDAIQAQKGEKRVKAAAEYIDKKDKGSRLTDGLARLKTYSFRLMADVHANHADKLRELSQLSAAGAGAEALRDLWVEFVKATYGDSFAKLSASLTKESTPKPKADPVDAMIEKAKVMTLTDLQRLAAAIQSLYVERQADEAAGAEAVTDDEGKTFAESGNSSLHPAAPAEAIAA